MKITIELPRSSAIKLLRQLEGKLQPSKEPMRVRATKSDLLGKPVTELPLPEIPGSQLVGRTRYVLINLREQAVAKTVEDLCRMIPRDLSHRRNVGPKIVNMIKEALAQKGLALAMAQEELDAYRDA